MELRQAMGFVQKPLTTALLSLMRPKPKFVEGGFALLEVCCDENSQLRAVCQAWGIPYRGITYGVEMRSVYERTRDWVATLKVGLRVHLSTLCSSGSPLRRFVTPGQASELDATWDEHISGAVAFMKFGIVRALSSHCLTISGNVGMSNRLSNDLGMCTTPLSICVRLVCGVRTKAS